MSVRLGLPTKNDTADKTVQNNINTVVVSRISLLFDKPILSYDRGNLVKLTTNNVKQNFTEASQ